MNYFRSHKQSHDLKGEFKLFASFTRPRRSLPRSLFVLVQLPSSHLILDVSPLSSSLFRFFSFALFPLSPSLPEGREANARVLLLLLPLSIRKDPCESALEAHWLTVVCRMLQTREKANERSHAKRDKRREMRSMCSRVTLMKTLCIGCAATTNKITPSISPGQFLSLSLCSPIHASRLNYQRFPFCIAPKPNHQHRR